MSRPPDSARGFTLIELAIAIFVFAIILSSMLVPLSTQAERRQARDTQQALEEIREAIVGFALSKGYLPCPAISSTNGLEDRTAGVCTGGKRLGFIPWQTLGASKVDAWGNIFRYSVTLTFTSSTTVFSLSTTPDIGIQTRTDAGALANLTNANTVVAVVLSAGRNGYGATNNAGTAQALPTGWPASFTDENTNSAGTTTFVSRPQQSVGASGTGGEFDDILVWLPRVTLVNRMVSAGMLP